MVIFFNIKTWVKLLKSFYLLFHNLDDPEPINPEATEEEKLQHYAESLS